MKACFLCTFYDRRIKRPERIEAELRSYAGGLIDQPFKDLVDFVCTRGKLSLFNRGLNWGFFIQATLSDADAVEAMLRWSEVRTPDRWGSWPTLTFYEVFD